MAIGRPLKSTKIRGVPKSEFFECDFGPLSSHPFSLIFPPSFPFRPCSLSHHFFPLHLPLYPPFGEKSDLGTPLIWVLFSVRLRPKSRPITWARGDPDRLWLRTLSGPVRDTPPYRAIPFRDSIAGGGIAPICLVFIGYRASIAEIPLLRGVYRTSTSHALQKGNAQKRGEGVSHPIGHVETPKNP